MGAEPSAPPPPHHRVTTVVLADRYWSCRTVVSAGAAAGAAWPGDRRPLTRATMPASSPKAPTIRPMMASVRAEAASSLAWSRSAVRAALILAVSRSARVASCPPVGCLTGSWT